MEAFKPSADRVLDFLGENATVILTNRPCSMQHPCQPKLGEQELLGTNLANYFDIQVRYMSQASEKQRP